MPRPKTEPLERFEDKIIRTDTGCWVWTAYVNADGYGLFRDGGKKVRAHRWAYEHFRGPIPEGHDLDHFKMNDESTRHRCSRACVNPDHLEAVTRQENSRRSERLRASARKTGRKTGRKNGLANRRHDLPEGVSPNGKRFKAQIHSPKWMYLGTFDTPEEASEVYRECRASVDSMTNRGVDVAVRQ